MSEATVYREAVNTCGAFAACRRCRASRLCQFVAAAVPVPGIEIINRQRRLRRGEALYRQGEVFGALHTVCSGAVKAVAGRTRRTVDFFIPGELAGGAGLTGGRHGADAVALEPSRVSEIVFASLADAMEALPALRRIVFELLTEQLVHEEESRQALVGKKAALERLSAYLLALAQRYEARGFSATDLPLAMSRNDMSSYLGLAKETVCRLFSRLKAEGLVSVDAHRLRIHDRERLTRLANGV
jgi:CRP/FNR family transcriptional regulator